MKEFFFLMMSEDGQPSSKRWIAATVAATLIWVIVYSTLKAANSSERFAIIIATMAFVLILLGVATLPQIISLIKGTPPKEDIK